jgi:hypothetical protein
MSTSKRGQASLEMVVGLIILLVVAGVVIGLVMTTMNSKNLTGIAGGSSKIFTDKCTSYCEIKDYNSYCSTTMFGLTGSKDWNGDGVEGTLVSAAGFKWDFCEDRVYCFLVTNCPGLSSDAVDGCRTFMCQDYASKYKGDANAATTKLKTIYKASDEFAKCTREDKKSNTKQLFSDLPSIDNWILSRFGDKEWCLGSGSSLGSENCGDGYCDCLGGETSVSCSTDCTANDCKYTCGANGCESAQGENKNNCPSDCGGAPPAVIINLGNCTYNTTTDSMTCDTNCLGTVAGTTTSFVVMDKAGTGNSSIAMDGTSPSGTITISGGKVIANPDTYVLMGAVKLSSLDQDTTQWVAFLSCQNPVGGGKALSGITKVS